MRLRPGTQLQNGSFIIDDTLGQGGFGITYQATDTSLNRPVALKEFFPNGVQRDPDGVTVSPTRTFPEHRFETFRAGFVEEGRMLAALDHPAIVPVHRVFEENGTAYLVMKLLTGQTIEEFFEEGVAASRKSGLPWAEAVTLIRSLEEVLTYLHGQEILHRDIKPANLFRLTNGQIVLLDFGAARGFASDQTQTMTYIGTGGFAPPEQSEKRARRGPFTDVYALSATLYYLITGEPPIHSLIRLQEDTQPTPQDLVPETPEWLSEAVMRGLAPVATERPQTVAAFCALLSAPGLDTSAPQQPAATVASPVPPITSPQPEVVTPPIAVAPAPAVPMTGPTLAQLDRLQTGIRTIVDHGTYSQLIALSQIAVALHVFNPREGDAVFQETARAVEGISTTGSAPDIEAGNVRKKGETLSKIAALWSRGNPQAAERVFQSALSLAESIPGRTKVWTFLGRLSNSRTTAYDKALLLSTIAVDWSEFNQARAKESVEQAASLSPDLRPDTDRNFALRSIAQAWCRINLSEALRTVGTIPDSTQQLFALREILKFWIKSDPQQALRVANVFPENHRSSAVREVAEALAKTDTQAALRIVDGIDSEYSRLYTWSRIAMIEAKHDAPRASALLQQALDFVRAQPVNGAPENISSRAQSLALIAEVWTLLSPERAGELFEEAYSTALNVKFVPWTVRCLCFVADIWSKTDPQRALSLLRKALHIVEDSEYKDDSAKLREIVQVWAKIDPQGAQTLVARLQSAEEATPVLREIAVTWSKRDRVEANRAFIKAAQTASTIQGSSQTNELAAIAASWFKVDLDAELDYVLSQPQATSYWMITKMAEMLTAPPEDQTP